jgi:lysozyme
MKTSTRGISLLIEFEGFRGEAYIPVPGDVPTIGFGFTKGVRMGDKMTLAQAKERLKRELVEYENAVLAACVHQPNQNQFDALVSFAFNVGVGGLRKSSVLKAHNRRDYQAAARAFGLWNKSGGVVYAGLTRRRAAESALYLEPVAGTTMAEEVPMPQRIDEEKDLRVSEINRASAVAGSTAALAAVSETVNAVNQVKYGVAGLGDWLVPALLIAVVGLCGYVVWQRWVQRRDGWA